jgi:hypothetical protein
VFLVFLAFLVFFFTNFLFFYIVVTPSSSTALRTSGSTMLTVNGSATLTTSKVYDLSPGQGMRPALCGTSLAGTGFRPAKRDGYKNRNSDTPLVGRGNNNLSHKPAPYLFHHQSWGDFVVSNSIVSERGYDT